MIQEEYVSFETAKLLKEKGFNEPTLGNYYIDGRFEESCRVNWNEHFKTPISAPTQQMAMRWLREIFKLYISTVTYITKDKSIVWGYQICNNTHLFKNVDCAYNTYEEAAEEAIKYCLENLI